MAEKQQTGNASIQHLIPVWLQNGQGVAAGVFAVYILFYIAWTQFHWGATEAFR